MGKIVLLGMSGGVDSTGAALLLREEGYRVIGVTLRLLEGEAGRLSEEAAVRAAQELGIKHRVVDFTERFRREVLHPFAEAYFRGQTPNPCVECNASCKLPALFKAAEEEGADLVATGHYAKVERVGKKLRLLRGKDRPKDQSYVLWRVEGWMLSRMLMPNGDLLKEEIRQMVLRLGPRLKPLPESRDACFLQGGDYRDLLERMRPGAMRPGLIVDASGRVLGRHRGYAAYTVGQRRGLGIASQRPLYVTAIDPERNLVVVGRREDALIRRVRASSARWLEGGPPSQRFRAQVKVRYQMEPVAAEVSVEGEDFFSAELEEPVPAAAPGQSVAVYRGEELLGGGIILSSTP